MDPSPYYDSIQSHQSMVEQRKSQPLQVDTKSVQPSNEALTNTISDYNQQPVATKDQASRGTSNKNKQNSTVDNENDYNYIQYNAGQSINPSNSSQLQMQGDGTMVQSSVEAEKDQDLMQKLIDLGQVNDST